MVNLQASFQSFKETILDVWRHPEIPYGRISNKISALRNDPEFFLKICQIMCAALLIKIARDPQPSSLSKLSHVFSAASMHDFYRFFKRPRELLFPIHLQRIKENALLNSLVKVLCDHFQASYEEDGNGFVINVDDENIVQFAKAGLEKQFKVMNEMGDAYQTADEFKMVLQRRFNALKTIHRDLDGVDKEYDFKTLDLDELQVPLSSPSLIAQFETINWTLLDCVCPFLFFRGWDLINTALWAEKLGRYPGFAWMKNQQLEIWVRAAVCSAFFLKLCEACRQLLTEPLTEQERRKARWNVAETICELISNGAAFMNSNGYIRLNQSLLQSLVIVAKGIGLMEIITRPPRKFFEEAEYTQNYN